MTTNAHVLVMGGSYFIGKHIVNVLLQRGYGVTTLSRGTYPPNEDTQHIACDRNDSMSMHKALNGKKFDFIVDVCALNRRQIEILFGCIDVLTIKQYIFISSGAVYASTNLAQPFRVGDSMGYNADWGDYGLNKMEAEKYLFEQFIHKSEKLTILRPPYVYGEDNYLERESFIFDHVINDKHIFIPSGGDRKIHFIYVRDLAEIVAHLLERPHANGLILNVCNKFPVTFNKWVAMCAGVVGKEAKTIHFDYTRHGYNARDFFPFRDCSNVMWIGELEDIYQKPETPMAEGLKNAFEWFLANRETIRFSEKTAENEQAILKLIKHT